MTAALIYIRRSIHHGRCNLYQSLVFHRLCVCRCM